MPYPNSAAQRAGDTPNPLFANGESYPMAGLLALIPQQLREGRILQYYGYNVNFLTLAASSTNTQNINIQADADFVITSATCIVTDATNATVLVYVPQLVLLTDTGAGNTLTQSAVPFNTIYGDANNPGIFAVPYPLRRNSTLQVQHQNLEAVARNVRCVFYGFRSVIDPSYRS